MSYTQKSEFISGGYKQKNQIMSEALQKSTSGVQLLSAHKTNSTGLGTSSNLLENI
jgi:hypothetical protein